MKYKSIFNVCLLTAFLLTATTSCDDWTEMEIHETDVNGAKEQNPEQYSVYTQNINGWMPFLMKGRTEIKLYVKECQGLY